ncbi:MAG: cold shock domain-containing protein, partial [Candidatus Hydrogenedentota bacterium]
FRPGLSLENTYFYQLMITMGVVLEGVTAAILLNPFVEPHPKDRSLGSVPKKFLPAMQVIIENTFKTNIDWMIHWKLLPNSLTYKLTQMRVSVRNQVHIQGWVGRIYGSIDFDTFKRTLKQFKELLIQIRDSIQPLPDPKQMWNFIFPDADPNAFFEGKIVHYNYEKGFGFIAAEKFQKNIYFHRQALSPNWKSVPDILGKKAYFQLGRNQKGRIAINIRIEGEPAS